MDGIFTLPYSEFEIVNKFQGIFKKKDGYSVYIPVSRQEKDVDFILTKSGSEKIARFQVKSSRTYIHEIKILKSGKEKIPEFKYNLWFNNFRAKYQMKSADFYILFGLYPIYSTQKGINSDFWKSIIVCLPDRVMNDTLQDVLTKRERKPDRFLGLSFNNPHEIIGTRGFIENKSFSQYLIDNQIDRITEHFV